MSTTRSLLLRSNRVLGASLVEHNLVGVDHLEAANERLFEILRGGVTPQANLLHILQSEMNGIEESRLIEHVVRENGLGLIDLDNFQIEDICRDWIEPEITWATWTVPFDKEDDFYFVATAYYLSVPARQFWEERLDGAPIIWYAASLRGIYGAVERLEAERAEKVKT